MLKKMFKYAVLFLIGAVIYYCIEMAYRGYSHWSMFLLGGVCFLGVGFINEDIAWEMSLLKQGCIGSLIITFLELWAGYILNICLGWHVWDYSDVPLNFYGQICLPFSLLWIPISIVAIILDDYLRYKLFGEEKPHYKLFGLKK